MAESSRHTARKRFGQHFLHDRGVIQRIIAAVHPQPGEPLVEIGPGRGALTRDLLRAVGTLDVVELDRDLIEPLRASCAELGELRIHQQDALRFDFCALMKNEARLRVIGNLPYNISTPLLFHLLQQAHCIRDMYFMLQNEVVERMVAAPGSRTYGRLSVMIQYRCAVTKLFHVGPGAFTPAPKVDSAVIRMVPHTAPPVAVGDEKIFEQVVRAAFAQRRKTLRNGLKELLTDTEIRALGIDPGVRAEQLSLQDFASLSNAVGNAVAQHQVH
ncbi:MAG: 16S rRNA (adenine(1518)-N(6)/adenine(1519)-N(6))-dimethyltransferase RsmA [Gammaproteobacteria bacterium]|nr:16S rRNA (adenine(1518)-N(6)/adenine(1519)-N(6))-dimethyltransferase RsmA [Gammaproteobacteria bacterium]